MADYCRILRDENCQQTKDHTSDYLIALLDDSNDFLWQAVKASHAVLLCHMEQGEVTSWSHTEKKRPNPTCQFSEICSTFSGFKQFEKINHLRK